MKVYAKLYSKIEDLFDLGWDPGTKLDSTTFSLKHERLTKQLGNGISLKLWINPKANPYRLDFEIVGKFEGRGDFAAALRKFLLDGSQPEGVLPSSLSASTKIIHTILRGTEHEQTEQIRTFIEYLSAKLRNYELRTSASPKLRNAVVRMVRSAIQAARQSGNESVTILKCKQIGFDSTTDFQDYLLGLIDDQEDLCALSQLPLLKDSEAGDSEFLMSLDRIDSNGYYEPGNLQIVCRFINRWKSDSDNEHFRTLLNAVRTASPIKSNSTSLGEL